MPNVRCSACGIEVEAGCNCGVKYVPVKEIAKKAIIEHPEMSNRAIAEQVGVSDMTVLRVRRDIEATATNVADDIETSATNVADALEPPMRVGRDGVRRPGRKTEIDRIREYNDATGFKILSVKIKRAKPIGRMPDDTRQKIEVHIREIKQRLTKLHKLADYADQMSTELRNLLADEMKQIKHLSERLAKDYLGGDEDLRKINRPLCDVEIPLRKEEEV